MTGPERFRQGYFDDERCKLYDHPEDEFVTRFNMTIAAAITHTPCRS
jgi:hypothetical protein